MAAPRRRRTRPGRVSWSTGTAASISKANPEKSPTPQTRISSDFWCEFRVVCFTVSKEGSSDGASKTTHVDGIARWPLRAGGSLRARGGGFLLDGGGCPTDGGSGEILFFVGSGVVGWGGCACGRGWSWERGIPKGDG